MMAAMVTVVGDDDGDINVDGGGDDGCKPVRLVGILLP